MGRVGDCPCSATEGYRAEPQPEIVQSCPQAKCEDNSSRIAMDRPISDGGGCCDDSISVEPGAKGWGLGA